MAYRLNLPHFIDQLELIYHCYSMRAPANVQHSSYRQLFHVAISSFYPRHLPSRNDLIRLIFHETPQILYNDGCVRVAMVCFFGMFIIAMLLGMSDPTHVSNILGQDMVDNMQEMYADHPSDRDASTAIMMQGFYIHNNVGISLMCFAGGIFAGIGSLLFLVFNGIFLGLIFGLMFTVDATTARHFFEFVTAHGPFELTGICLSGAAGFRMGLGLFDNRGQSRVIGLQQAAHKATPILLVAALMVALAAPIEAWISPSSVSLTTKRAVGICCLITILWYLVFLGWRSNKVISHKGNTLSKKDDLYGYQ